MISHKKEFIETQLASKRRTQHIIETLDPGLKLEEIDDASVENKRQDSDCSLDNLSMDEGIDLSTSNHTQA